MVLYAMIFGLLFLGLNAMFLLSYTTLFLKTRNQTSYFAFNLQNLYVDHHIQGYRKGLNYHYHIHSTACLEVLVPVRI